MDIKVRLAGTGDVPQLLKIYEQYIDTPITFEYTLPTIQDFTKRILSLTKDYPYIVCEKQGRLVGVCLCSSSYGKGSLSMECGAVCLFGPALYFPGNRKKAVLRFNRTLGKAGSQKCSWRRYASKCEKLHLGLGFSCLGVYRRIGFKCGQWRDVAWFGKEIGPYTQEPTPLKSISDLSSEYLNMILQKYSSADSE